MTLAADDDGVRAQIAAGTDPAELRVLYLRTRAFDAEGLSTVTQEVTR